MILFHSPPTWCIFGVRFKHKCTESSMKKTKYICRAKLILFVLNCTSGIDYAAMKLGLYNICLIKIGSLSTESIKI